MSRFRMPDGTFIEAPNHAAANTIFQSAKNAPGVNVGATQPVGAQVVFTAVITPEDNFNGRSTTKFGVGERLDLSFTTNPARNAADATSAK